MEIEAWLRSGVAQAEVCRRLRCRPDTLRPRLRSWGLDHLKNPSGKGTEKHGNRKPAAYYLKLDGPIIGAHRLKKKLWSEGLKPKHCEECGWAQRAADGRLPLELDHENGNRFDNRIDNLKILCPNCHALRPTNGGLNAGSYAQT